MKNTLLPAEANDRPQARPRFLWDYDLSEAEVKTILKQPGFNPTKCWLIERLLLEARLDEIVAYVNPNEISQALPSLRLPPKLRQWWEYALSRWMHHD